MSTGYPPYHQLLEVYAVATDRPTLSLLLYNFAAIGTLLVFWSALGLGAPLPLPLHPYPYTHTPRPLPLHPYP